MATQRDWADAYLSQARADLAAAKAMGTASPSTLAMVLQMVFEKLAKAALIRKAPQDLEIYRKSHKAASRWLHALRNEKELAKPLGGTKEWEDVLFLVNALEKAHPQLAQAHDPQLEYPWERLDGTIQWPDQHLAIARKLGDPKNNMLARVLRFATLIEQRMFPAK